MSAETLADPVLGVLTRLATPDRDGDRPWMGRAWLSPKHQIEVAFNPFHTDARGMPPRLLLARQTWQTIAREEWRFRLETARQLDEESNHEWAEGRDDADPVELARMLRPVRVVLFGDGSAHLIYRGPPPFANGTINSGVNPDGSFDLADFDPLE